MITKAYVTFLMSVICSFAIAQGYADLGSDATGYALPERGYTLDFPSDHGAHPDFRIEWWYLTSNLEGDDGNQYGIQWTLFRSALKPGEIQGWSSPQIWMGHAAVTSPTEHHFAERFSRGGIGTAGVDTAPFNAWIDDWHMTGQPGLGLSHLSLFARGHAFSYDLQMKADGSLILHGDRGYSVKSRDGQASYYYSQPAYEVSGTLNLPNGAVQVQGQGWLDREWSSQPLSGDQNGWDWLSLSFDGGSKLMGFQLRDSKGDFTSATWIYPDGTSRSLADGHISFSPVSTDLVKGREIPTRWSVKFPEYDVDIQVEALNPQSWMGTSFSYWEGPVIITGSHKGRGYLEMTGYE